MRILLVDDDHSLSLIYRIVLEGDGHSVTCARSAENAFEAISSAADDFDLMLVDYSMPRMTGAQFVETARTKVGDKLRGTRVVGFSSFVAGVTVLEKFKSQVDELVEKPDDLEGAETLFRRLCRFN